MKFYLLSYAAVAVIVLTSCTSQENSSQSVADIDRMNPSVARTGKQIQAATGLLVEQKLTVSLGGVIQIAAEVASGNVLAVIFLVEPLAAPFEPRLDALLHICNVHNVALATNLATASAIAIRLAKTRVAHNR